jgi:hypothetical protein
VSRIARRALLAGLGAALLAPRWAAARAPQPELAAWLPGARLQGQARMSFIGLPVYDIRLWVIDGFDAAAFEQHPLALEIVYARGFAGQQLAERSLAEMQRVASISPAQREAWLAAMLRAFPDVKPGERLTGVHRPAQGVRFFHSSRHEVEVADPAFARAFFAIWLSPRTSEPRLRSALLGAAT